jgi:hypothetical protein
MTGFSFFIFVLLCSATALYAALPPGFEDEIYCPKTMCLRRRAKLHGYKTGPRTMFVECFDPVTKETCRPRAWGNKLEKSYRDSLLSMNWHTDKCGENDIRLDYMLLGARVDSIIEKLAMLSFL